jgi:hypothetical protein
MYPHIVDAPLDNLLRHDKTVLVENLMQSWGDTACAEVASNDVIIIVAERGRPALLNDDDIELEIETSAFLKKVAREERAGRSAANDRYTVTLSEDY